MGHRFNSKARKNMEGGEDFFLTGEEAKKVRCITRAPMELKTSMKVDERYWEFYAVKSHDQFHPLGI